MHIALIPILTGILLGISSASAQLPPASGQSAGQTSIPGRVHDIGGTSFGTMMPERSVSSSSAALQRALLRSLAQGNAEEDSMWTRVGVGALIGAALGVGVAAVALSKMEDPIVDPAYYFGVPALVGAVLGGAIAAPTYDPGDGQKE